MEDKLKILFATDFSENSRIAVQRLNAWQLELAEKPDPKKLHVDYSVVGAKGHSKLHQVLMGSTAEKILRYSPCSLLVAR